MWTESVGCPDDQLPTIKDISDGLSYFYREKLARRLVIALEDQIEKNRELSIEIFTKMIERTGLKDEA